MPCLCGVTRRFPAAAVPTLLAGVLLAGCSSAPVTNPPGAATPTPSATVATRTPATPAGVCPAITVASVFGHAVSAVQVAVTPAGSYAAWQFAAQDTTCTELARFDPDTGHIQAAHQLGVIVTELVQAGDSLWAAASGAAGPEVLRLDPASLEVSGRPIPIGGRADPTRHALAAAGGNLWAAAGDHLVEIALPAGTVTATLDIPRATRTSLGADDAGTLLVEGDADVSGNGAVHRRDPGSGAVLATQPMTGVSAPDISGVLGTGVWLAEPTGLRGYVERLDTTTLAPDPNTRVDGSNGISVLLANGLVWVTDRASGPGGTAYCAEPAAGHPRATLPLPHPDQDTLAAVTTRQLLYLDPDSHGEPELAVAPIPPACLRNTP